MKVVAPAARSSKSIAIDALRAIANCSSSVNPYRRDGRWRNNFIAPRNGLLLFKWKHLRNKKRQLQSHLASWEGQVPFRTGNESHLPLLTIGTIDANVATFELPLLQAPPVLLPKVQLLPNQDLNPQLWTDPQRQRRYSWPPQFPLYIAPETQWRPNFSDLALPIRKVNWQNKGRVGQPLFLPTANMEILRPR